MAKDRPPADPVGQGAGAEERRGQGQSVGVDHPLHLAEAGVEVGADRR
jgi:hypothetical protein